ncbi:MAG: Sporulation protein YtxC [Clostridia bacterium]|jgi:putative sporulation protein YtxC|nr:Sporulation protein YtxC [Clostridia bacterium]
MYECVLYTTKYKDDLQNKFKEAQHENDLADTFDIAQVGDIYRVRCCANDILPESIETLAHIASDIVQKESLMQIAGGYLKQRKDISLIDKREIERRFVTNNYLSRQEGFSSLNYYFVYTPILAELKSHNRLNIDGWVRFRTCKYRIILEDILEQFIEDYFIKKDIIQFIKMVREISSMNDPLEDTLHLICTQSGRMRILNEDMEDVTTKYTQEYCKELLTDSTLNKEDLIMNILITVCPRRIIVHQKERAKHPEFFKTLEGIFGINIKYCSGCKYCTDNTITIKL